MPDTFSLPDNVTAQESYIKISDRVELKIIDFKPEDDVVDNPVIVFVAGWISLIQGWQDVLNVITPCYRTLYIETREKISAKLPENSNVDFSIQRMSRDIDEILTEILPENKNFYFVGSSLGSTIILYYLSVYKRQPEKSFLIAPLCEFNIPGWGVLLVRISPVSLYVIIKPIIKWYLRNFRLDPKSEPEQVAKYEGTLDAAEPNRLKKNALSIKDFSLWKSLPLIPSPVLIIGAGTDKLHEVDTMEKMASLIPTAQLEMMNSNKETHSEKAGRLIIKYINTN